MNRIECSPRRATAHYALGLVPHPPSLYLPALARSADAPLDAIERHVATHAADPAFMFKDDFEGFIADRRGRLLRMIVDAMGKRIEGTLGEGIIEPAETDEDLDDV